MNEELEIEELEVTIDAAACIEVSRCPGAMVKATVHTITDVLLAVIGQI